MKLLRNILIYLLLSAPAFAEEVTVQGQQVPEPQAAHPTATVNVIDTSGSTEHVSQVGEALEQSAGVTVRRFGGLGDYNVIMVRGTSPNQVGIYLDGIPLSGAAQGVINLANLPLDPLQRIEVYRGAAPLEFGSNMGGAINLVTRQAPGGWAAGLSESYGSFGTFKSDLFGSGTFGAIGGLIFYSHFQSEGNFEYLDDNGTPFNRADDKYVTRQNNDFMSDDLLIKLSWRPFAHLEFFMGNEFFDKDAGVPGIGSFQSNDARLTTLRNTLHVGAKYRAGIYEIKAMSFYTYTEDVFNDPLGEIGLAIQKNRYITDDYGANALGRVFIGSRGTIALFVEGRGETYRAADLMHDVNEPESSRASLTGAIQGEVYLFKARVILVPTLRVENYANHFTGNEATGGGLPAASANNQGTLLSPHFGLKIKPWEMVTFHANVGQYYRLPTFFELFGDRGSVVGNPDLKVESGIHSDAGATLSLKKRSSINKMTLSYTYFYISATDLIIISQNSQRTARAENVGAAEIAGHEVMAEGETFEHVRLRAAYTFQQAVDRSDIPYLTNRPLPGRPHNELHFGLTLFQPRWGNIFYTMDYIDGNFLDRTGLLEIPARTIHGAGITVTPIKNLAVTFEAKNLGNEQISDVLGYPLPGLSFFGTVSYKYSRAPNSVTGNEENNQTQEGVVQ